ncbi:MAG: 50S ribosomal protein L11 methyltransferase [Burkholderiaceae bacterium]
MIELVLLARDALVEPLSQRLIDVLDAGSVAVEDAQADEPDEQPLYGEPGLPAPADAWPHSRVVALFTDEAQARAAAAWALAWGGDGGVRLGGLRDVPDEDWVRLTQSQFAPVPVSPGFWIVPSWHDVPAEATRVIRLDPGQAFGTGTHPTTQMCLRWIAGHVDALARVGVRVLDYGCGSGVLAIAAALHGAKDIDAVDIDPAAVQATRDNALANGVSLHAGGAEIAQGAYGLVLANILATPLTVLAPLLSAHVAPGGHLVLAGILSRQADMLRSAYAGPLDLAVADEQDGWILMSARRDV